MAVAWVSGASSGLGLHTATALVQAGWQVVGGARSYAQPDAMGQAQAQLMQMGLSTMLPAGEGSFSPLPLDVTSQASVDSFCEAALMQLGPPDALVNAAGLTLLGACEEYTLAELDSIMQVNFLGAARMTGAVLPLMRQRGKGRIVMLSSINGLLATPFQGAYAASKHALEGYSEALMMEVAPHGIQVMIVQPGDHRGGAQAYRGRSAHSLPCYGKARQSAGQAIARDEGGGGDPGHLGRRVAKAMGKKHMPLRLRVAPLSQHMAVMLHDLLPGRLYTRLMAAYYGVNQLN